MDKSPEKPKEIPKKSNILAFQEKIDGQLLQPTGENILEENVMQDSKDQRNSLIVPLNELTYQQIEKAKAHLLKALDFIKKWKNSDKIKIDGQAFRFSPFFDNPDVYLPLMMKESGLNNDAKSSKEAIGYFQIAKKGAAAEIKKHVDIFSPRAKKDVKLNEFLYSNGIVYKTPINNCIYGIIYFHYCLERYANNDAFKGLSQNDKKSLAYMIYNAGPTNVIKLWKLLKPDSYEEFESKLSQNLAKQLKVAENKSEEKYDDKYGVYYPENSAIKKYRELIGSKKLDENFKIEGVNTNIPLRKIGETLRYVRVIEAIENTPQYFSKPKLEQPKKQETLPTNKEILTKETIGQYAKLKNSKYVRDLALMRSGAERFKYAEWKTHPKWDEKNLAYRAMIFNGKYRLKEVKYIILHSTGGETSVNTVDNRKAHFVVEKNGLIRYLVHCEKGGNSKNKIAPHAGVSAWNKDDFLNEYSIGIEVVANAGSSWTPAQYETVKKLVHFLGGHFNLRKRNVLMHKQVSYSKYGRGNKSDPYDNPSALFQNLGLPDNSKLLDLQVKNGEIEANMQEVKQLRYGAWDGLKAAIQ